MDKDLAQKVEKFQQGIAKEAEDIVFRVFPTKILVLNELLEKMDDSSSPFHPSNSQAVTDTTIYPAPEEETVGRKRRKVSEDEKPLEEPVLKRGEESHATGARYTQLIRGNNHISQTIHKTLKTECEELATLTDKVRVWVTLTLPKIEDGDNFGVQVLEDVLGELQRSQEAALNLRDIPRQNYLTRAKICSKLIKYPNVEDYAMALKEHDQKQLFSARQHILDIRNVYASLTDMMHKNISKIRKPKANNSINLY